MISTAGYLFLTILGFGFLILIHEAGHFLLAKRAGIRAHHFAIGFGPVLCSWRSGIGFRWQTTNADTLAKFPGHQGPVESISRDEMRRCGIGETAYELRILPLGGFVGMAGQDDTDAGATSQEDGAFNRASLGARMWVISGGVIANIILGVILFCIAFMHGVEFEAPVLGGVAPGSPAALAGLRAGDIVVAIDGEAMKTFTDCRVASALSSSGTPLNIEIDRPVDGGAPQRLTMQVTPTDSGAGIRQLGIVPSTSLTIPFVRLREPQKELLASLGITSGDGDAAIDSITIVGIAGTTMSTYSSLAEAFARAHGDGIAVNVAVTRANGTVKDETITLFPTPALAVVLTPEPLTDGQIGAEMSLGGLVPLVRVGDVIDSGSAKGILERNDIILRAGGVVGPRREQFRSALQSAAGSAIDCIVDRAGKEVRVSLPVASNGTIGTYLEYAWNDPRTADPMVAWKMDQSVDAKATSSPSEGHGIMALSTIQTVDGHAVRNWYEIARIAHAISDSTSEGISLPITVVLPTVEHPIEQIVLEFDSAQRAHLALGAWSPPLPREMFLPSQVILSADGNPLRAISLGFEQTGVILSNVFLTLKALVLGDVGVAQLSGPVGIVHAGTIAAERSVWYLLFFLALISVNLAFINAMPIPIADGGHMSYLLWERITGKAPSQQFQSMAALVGMGFFAGLFLLTFYNDIARLIS